MPGNKRFEIVANGNVTTPRGFRAGGLHCGLKKTERNDLGVIVSDRPCAAAGVFTTNAFKAAPLIVTEESLRDSGQLQVMLVNSGNANACTGNQGMADAYEMRRLIAQTFGIDEKLAGVTSTGVIGELLKMDKVRSGISKLADVTKATPAAGEQFSNAILTTDLIKKEACVRLVIDDVEIHIAGTAKGSGMIHPNMATMLGFITTDANISTEVIHQLLRDVTDRTFNMITVDGDTSTNDMVVVMANGMAENKNALSPQHPQWADFVAGFQYVSEQLAKAIARDGEGATKLIECTVEGAITEEAARGMVKTVIGSSLVKSAVYGADANWGRIIAAIGRAGFPVRTDAVDIRLGGIEVLRASQPVSFDEERAAAYLKGDMVHIVVNLHHGEGRATGWGCDLTYDYVRINAAYRT